MRERTGLTVRATAKLLGKSTSSYQFYEDEFKKPELPMWLVKGLLSTFPSHGIGRLEILALGGITPEMLANISAPKQFSNPSVEVLVYGAVQAGEWVESYEWPADEHYRVAVKRDPRFPNATYHGLEVRGSSMNRVYPEGTVLVCVPTIEQQVEPQSGQHVVVQRRDEFGLYETSVKEFVVQPDGTHWLWPRSDDPEHQAPLKLVDNGEEDGVVITGLVVRSIIPEPTS